MPLRLVRNGPKYTVYAYEGLRRGGLREGLAVEWLVRLPSGARGSLTNLLARHASDGPIRNRQKCRLLRDGIYEFKDGKDGGYRLLWFYAPGQRSILCHGFGKGAPLDPEIERAILTRQRWQGENA